MRESNSAHDIYLTMRLINRAILFGAMLSLPVSAATAGVVHAAPETPDPVIHVVQSGDNLSGIAFSMYGKSSQWESIRDANVDVLESVDSLQVGMELRIPEL
mgnify:CR=1 FL=1